MKSIHSHSKDWLNHIILLPQFQYGLTRMQNMRKLEFCLSLHHPLPFCTPFWSMKVAKNANDSLSRVCGNEKLNKQNIHVVRINFGMVCLVTLSKCVFTSSCYARHTLNFARAKYPIEKRTLFTHIKYSLHTCMSVQVEILMSVSIVPFTRQHKCPVRFAICGDQVLGDQRVDQRFSLCFEWWSIELLMQVRRIARIAAIVVFMHFLLERCG